MRNQAWSTSPTGPQKACRWASHKLGPSWLVGNMSCIMCRDITNPQEPALHTYPGDEAAHTTAQHSQHILATYTLLRLLEVPGAAHEHMHTRKHCVGQAQARTDTQETCRDRQQHHCLPHGIVRQLWKYATHTGEHTVSTNFDDFVELIAPGPPHS